MVRKAHLDANGNVIKPEERKSVSHGEINRELEALKSIFLLAVRDGKLPRAPRIQKLEEHNTRVGFFEPEQMARLLPHLPADVQPVVQFAYLTGWRLASEVLPLQWRQVDFAAGEVRLDAGMTKNGQSRVIYMTDALRVLLKKQYAEHKRLAQEGHICPHVFFREGGKGSRGVEGPRAIRSIRKAWNVACRKAGLLGRIPHDLRRSAVRNMVRAGVPERVAMRMTGHKTPSVFARYDIVADSDLRDAATRLNRVS